MAEELKITMAAARANAGLTQEEVARQMHLNKQTIVNWEKGRITPKPAQFYMYCEIVGMSRNHIFLPGE